MQIKLIKWRFCTRIRFETEAQEDCTLSNESSHNLKGVAQGYAQVSQICLNYTVHLYDGGILN